MRPLILFIAGAVLLTGCGGKTDKTTDRYPYQEDPKVNALLSMTSGYVVDRFGKELKAELMSALNEGGAVNAIRVCQVRASQIAAAHSGPYWTIRRVTDRNRNPDNLADELAQAVMTTFNDTTIVTPEYVIRWNDTDSGQVYCQYRPIIMAPLCVKCHGTAEDIDNVTAAALAERYPSDRAIGYRVGELRGVFVVQIRWPEGRGFADSVVALMNSGNK